MADKIVKAFEALRSHYLQEPTEGHAQQQVVSTEIIDSPGNFNKKKDVSLSKRERINYCNAIADFLPMQSVKDINEFPRLMALAMELLLVCCGDNEGDVRLVAGECINKITKAFLDSNIGRIQVELYKEIKKNDSSRSLKAAMQRFGDTCHLIRVNKCRPYVTNLMPCIAKIARRDDDSIQEVLGTMMLKLCPVLGGFMTEADIKVLLKTFLNNLKSSSAMIRRTAASILNSLCNNSKKPAHFYSWLISMLLGMITPLTEDLPAHIILGVLLSFRNIVPHLSEVEENNLVMKGSFGAKKSSLSPIHGSERHVEKKQYLQIYEITMFCTKHTDHNVVTAALENLYQLLLSKAQPLLEILLSPSGIAPTITGQLTLLSEEKTRYTDSLIPSESGDSGVTSDLQSLSSMSINTDFLSERENLSGDKTSLSESSLGEAGQSLDSALYSEIPDLPSLKVTQHEGDATSKDEEDDDNEATHEEEGLHLPRTYTQGSVVNIEDDPISFQRNHLDSNVSYMPDNFSQTSLEELYRGESISSVDIRAVIERQFNFDAVACTGVPLLHCVRLMCSFLLAGDVGKLLPDFKTRVSVKSLSLHCISAALKLFPEAIVATVIPDEIVLDNKNDQLVRDIFLFTEHSDPQIRGAIAGIAGHLIAAVIQMSNGDIDHWNLKMTRKYSSDPLDFKTCIEVLLDMFTDESAVVTKLSCLAVKSCILDLCESTYNVYAYKLAWNLLSLTKHSYWLVKTEIVEVFQKIDYKLMLVLEKPWIRFQNISKLSERYVDLQQQVVENVLMSLLADEDARVRYSTSLACVKLIPNLYCSTTEAENIVQYALLARGTHNHREPLAKNKRLIEANLSYVIRIISQHLQGATTKYLTHGCTQCLFYLSEEYPVSHFPYAWECFPSYACKTVEKNNRPLTQISRQLHFNVSQIQDSSNGLLNTIFNLISASWLTLDLQAHQEALKLCVHLICGTCSKHLQTTLDDTQAKTKVDVLVGEQLWSTLKDPELISFAKKLFLHLTRMLCILSYVIDQTNPMANLNKLPLGLQGKDKTPVPGVATVVAQTSNVSPGLTSGATSNSPRKFTLSKAIHKRQGSDDKSVDNPPAPTPESKTNTPTSLFVGTADKNEKLGVFQHIPHLVKLYETLKGAFKNYQVLPVTTIPDKFGLFVRGVLESLGLLLELATFQELSAHTEEFLQYLQATARVEEEFTFLTVQQLLKALFGTNVASQPDMFELAESTKHLFMTHGDPTFAYDVAFQHQSMNEIQKDLYSTCFSNPYQETCATLKMVPVVDPTTLERGSRALSFIRNIKKNIAIPQRPTANISKERLSSIQSYIRLFEPLVIHALKSYTTTSSTQLQCQAIHLLDQLIRLRVNYSLLDSDQVFIGFVLKQFEFVESGQIIMPERFLSTVFQFLVLLSYECYQPKYTQAKAIIGMPRIIRLCDSIMACGQPAVTHAIPALKPIVQDLFAAPSQARADSGKDLDTQREVAVSMLLRVIQYPEVLGMLAQVLNGSKSDKEKWKRLSRQIIDALLPSLSKLEVQLSSIESLHYLYNLLDAVAPLSLRPADIILKSLFEVQIPVSLLIRLPRKRTRNKKDRISSLEVLKGLSMVIALLRTLIMQNSEDIIFSRMQQLDVSLIRASFLLTPSEGEFLLKTKRNEQTASHYLTSFMIYILQVALNELLQNQQKLEINKDYLAVLTQLLESYLMLLVYIGKSGNYKKLSISILALLFTPMESANQKDLSVLRCITRKFSLLKQTDSLAFLKWLLVLQTFGVSDFDFWKEFCKFDEADEKHNDRKHYNWRDGIVSNGSLLLYCEIIVNKLKEQNNLDIALVATLLNWNIKEIILNMNEPPIKELICRVLQNNELTALFIQSVSQVLTSASFKMQPTLMKSLLHHLECVDLTYSSTIVQLLFTLIPSIRIYGLARKAETLACRRIEYLQSLTTESALQFDELRSFTENLTYTKRYPRLCSLIQRSLKCDSSKPSISSESHPLATTFVDINKYTISKEWVYNFVESLCYAPHKTEEQSRSVVKLLRSLNLKDIENIMMNEKFNAKLLSVCIHEAQKSNHSFYSHGRNLPQSGLELSSLYDTGGSSEHENKERLLRITKTLILKRISEITGTLTDTVDVNNEKYMCYTTEKLAELYQNKDFLATYFVLLKCLTQFLSASCYYNQTWNLLINDTYNIMIFMLILPRFCVMALNQKNDNMEALQYCFRSLGLLFHCREFTMCMGSQLYAYILSETIIIVHSLLTELFLRSGEKLVETKPIIMGGYNESPGDEKDAKDTKQKDEVCPFKESCKRVSELVHCLSALACNKRSINSRIPWFLIEPIEQTIAGLARIPFVNSYARIPPIVWKFGWDPAPEGPLKTELPPLPVEILKEKEVLEEFVFRVNHVGWTSRMQFEETWAALLGVLSSPPMMDENTSAEEEIELVQASCLAVHCITSLLLDTTLAPVPGNVTISRYSAVHRQKDYPFLGSKAGKKLSAIRHQIELLYQRSTLYKDDIEMNRVLYPVVPSLLSARQRKQQLLYGCMLEGKLFVSNLETSLYSKNYGLGQVAASAIRLRLVTSDVQEDTDSDDSDSLIIQVNEKSPVTNQPSAESYKKLEELDIKSCLQFLLELFEQWLSVYATTKIPLMLKMEAIKSLCILSDFLLELTHYEWVLGILWAFIQTHPQEDDILLQYLIPTMCKALAVLKLEGAYAESICKQIEVGLRSPHIPLQVSCLVGSLYILESYVNSTNIILAPILTDYITRKFLSFPENLSVYSQRYLIVLWSTSFYLVENCASEIQDPHFVTTVLETAVTELCKPNEIFSHNVYDVLFRGLERLAVSFSLTRPECDRLAKISSNCVLSGSSKRLVSALGLLCTCMYTGKDAEQASGLSTIDFSVDAPINDSRLVVMERINVLVTRGKSTSLLHLSKEDIHPLVIRLRFLHFLGLTQCLSHTFIHACAMDTKFRPEWIRKGQLSEAILLATILPRILLDFLPVQEVMNKLISEFLSSQQPRPELIAKIFNKVSDLLFKEGEEVLVRDWVFLCIGSFVQRTPYSMAVWSLTCFFISTSSNPWLKSLFPYIVERKGKLEEEDRDIFCMAGLDFYSNQNLDAKQKQQFIKTFQDVVDNFSSPYERLIQCCAHYE